MSDGEKMSLLLIVYLGIGVTYDVLLVLRAVHDKSHRDRGWSTCIVHTLFWPVMVLSSVVLNVALSLSAWWKNRRVR